MEDRPCYICNTITGNKYKITNSETYFVCSDECKNKLLTMKSVLWAVHALNQKYGMIHIDEISNVLNGWIKPTKTKRYLSELIKRNFLARESGGFVKPAK